MRSLNHIGLAVSILLQSGTSQAATFKPVNLKQPLNWVAGPDLFPGRVIAGYNANLTDYTATSWGAHVLAACAGFTTCTSALAFQAANSGSTGGQFWFGYAFSGGPTDESYYDREDGPNDDVKDSAAWTIVQ